MTNSTIRHLVPTAPVIRNSIDSKIHARLSLPAALGRRGEGGLRLRGSFKTNGDFETAPNPGIPPLVSIITVVFNGIAHIERSIQSVLGQDFENLEYIIVDGGSTDGTVSVLEKYDEWLDYWISEPDRGISDAFNKGLALATGRYVGLINADDWYSPNAVNQVVSAMERHDADVAHGQLQYWSAHGPTELVCGDDALLERDMTVNHPTVFVRRSLYTRIGGFDSSFRCAMDYEWLRRAKAAGAIFHHIPATLAHMSLGGVSDVRWKEAIGEVFRVKRMYSEARWSPRISYALQLARWVTRRLLERLGLAVLVRIYHARFSLVRKIQHSDLTPRVRPDPVKKPSLPGD